MATLPRITIVTPSYNQGRFIEETIQSVLSQGYPDLEYIVIDGGSTDETLSILKKYGREIQWVSERDRGQAHAINKGLRMATGDVVAFLNSDDLYKPGALLSVGEFFALHPQAHWLTGRCCIIDEYGREIRRPITLYKNLWLSVRSYTILLVLNYISQPATFWRRSVLDTVGYLNEDLCYTMDYEYWLRIGRLFRLWFIGRELACFRYHSFSKSSLSTRAQFDEELTVARCYTRSRILLGLHNFHRALTLSVYESIQDSEREG